LLSCMRKRRKGSNKIKMKIKMMNNLAIRNRNRKARAVGKRIHSGRSSVLSQRIRRAKVMRMRKNPRA
jgi:hypothetical protein